MVFIESVIINSICIIWTKRNVVVEVRMWQVVGSKARSTLTIHHMPFFLEIWKASLVAPSLLSTSIECLLNMSMIITVLPPSSQVVDRIFWKTGGTLIDLFSYWTWDIKFDNSSTFWTLPLCRSSLSLRLNSFSSSTTHKASPLEVCHTVL
jgi:hypothetical protein